MSYNSIKNKLKIEEFTGNLPQFIYQDIYTQIVVYNQIQDMLYTGRKEIKSSKGNEYKINEGKAIGIFKEKIEKVISENGRQVISIGLIIKQVFKKMYYIK